MVIGLFIVTAIPTVTGVCQAVSAQKNRDQRLKDEQRMKKFHIDIESDDHDAREGQAIDMGRVVLKLDRLWVGPPHVGVEGAYGYVAEAFYIEYPDSERVPVPLGLASQVRNDPPLLNWIYVKKDTMELRYGNRTASIDHHVGSWDWTDSEEHVTFERPSGRQGEDFFAVERPDAGKWQLFCDMERNGLAGYVPSEWRKVKVWLKRRLISDL